MNRFLILATLTICTAATVTVSPAPQDDERRAAIRVLRAINTAENAARGTSGAYVQLTELLNHPQMGGVKADVVVSGTTYTYHGAQIRLALSVDATQYVVTVVSGAPNYTAAFSDERGVIYTGEALK